MNDDDFRRGSGPEGYVVVVLAICEWDVSLIGVALTKPGVSVLVAVPRSTSTTARGW